MINYVSLGILLFSSIWISAAETSPQTLPLRLDGTSFNPLIDANAKAVVLIFLASDCPISNRYAPLVNRIYQAYKDKGVDFYGVYPMSAETAQGIKSHRNDFKYTFPALMDKDHFLVDKAEAMVTPEVSVYIPSQNGQGTWIYTGRIDDLFIDFGKWRHAATKNDLSDVLNDILSGKTLHPVRTRAVGCYIQEN